MGETLCSCGNVLHSWREGPGQGAMASTHKRPHGVEEGSHLREEHPRQREQSGGLEEQQGCLVI